MQERQFTLSEGPLQKILNYLGTRPYVEVFEVVKAIQTATLVQGSGTEGAGGSGGEGSVDATATDNTGAGNDAAGGADQSQSA